MPDDIAFQAKPAIALEQIRIAQEAGVSPGVVLADAGYGSAVSMGGHRSGSSISTGLLPEDLRGAGIGSRVLAMAEEEARRRGCTRITLTTLSVQAPGFYQKQRYDIAATIDCDPPGLTHYYMMKRVVPLCG